MLRKITHMFLALFLLISTTGITVSMHYCHGKLVSASIIREAKSCCDGTGGCCENKVFHFEIKDNFLSPVQLDQIRISETNLLFPVLFNLNIKFFKQEVIAYYVYFDSSPPLIILNQQAIMQTYLC